ncbi:potassium channel family protein [Heyndrickxia camelliae]|uniref:Ion transporter n=1 Tax=Heyndrickxia camelliae TaxID=1707093 RepID=A0A2N3LH07_9BACI|nr:potassium channel family protein [Heyndrickxia camelliae]PKR83845.1 ion transporter [Heyndrickxia camelliae]
MLQNVYFRILRWPIIIKLLLLIFGLIISFGIAIHYVEPKQFPTIFTGIWWAVITTATVGYGDVYPITVKGRILGIFLVLTGAGVVSAYFASIAASTIRIQNAAVKGTKMFTGRNHIIVVGWNGRSKNVIDQWLDLDKNQAIVLIDDTLDRNPYPTHQVHFVKGKASVDETLYRAGLKSAKYILITADQNENESHADMGSILILLAVKGFHPDIYCVVEILMNENVINAKRAGADEVIQTNAQSSYIMINSLLSHGMSDTILMMLDHIKGNHLKYIPMTERWNGKYFEEISTYLKEERKLLIGLKRGDQTIINPPSHFQILTSDQLLVIAN